MPMGMRMQRKFFPSLLLMVYNIWVNVMLTFAHTCVTIVTVLKGIIFNLAFI